jgi:Holliday junction DNA helicase RuvB
MNKSVNARSKYPHDNKNDVEDEMNMVAQLASQAASHAADGGAGSTKIVRAQDNTYQDRKEGVPNIVRADIPSDEDAQENSLRPKTLSEFLGQSAIKENLSVFINAARERKESLDHLFLIGPPGLGKTTLAQITANELGADFKVTSAPALDKPKDLAGILSTITPRTVFFIDEIHRLKPAIEEMLYIAMEDFELDWVIGQGAAARTVRIPIPQFTLVGATTKAGMVSSPLISRFGIIQRFNFYSNEELAEIIHRSAKILNVSVAEDAALLMAACSRGTPRVANRVLRRMRDFAQVKGSASITKSIVAEGLKRLDIDNLGLEKYDREILLSIINNFGGGPVGADTLAISIGESMDTLEDYYEPYLIQCGLLQRTPRGRVVTDKAYQHLGLTPHRGTNDENQRLLF